MDQISTAPSGGARTGPEADTRTQHGPGAGGCTESTSGSEVHAPALHSSERPRRSTTSKASVLRCTSLRTTKGCDAVPRVQIQFHADPREVVKFAIAAARRDGFRVVVERFFPTYRAVELSGADLGAAESDLREVNRIALCRAEPDVSATTAHEFVSRNAECLFLSLEEPTDAGLRESTIAGATTDADTLGMWRALVRQVRSEMHEGAIARNPRSGAENRLPKHLHTAGAHALAEQGVAMLAGGGWVEYEFDDLAASPVPADPDPGAR